MSNQDKLATITSIIISNKKTMNVIIYSKNLELELQQKKQIEEKFKKLSRFDKQIISCNLDLSHDAHHKKGQVYRVEANVSVPDKMFRVVIEDYDLLSGVIKVRDKVERALIEHKDKKSEK